MATQAGVEPQFAEQQVQWSDWIQIIAGYAAIEAALWTQGLMQGVCMIAATVLIIAMSVFGRRPAQQLGVGIAGFARSLWAIPIAACTAVMILLASWALQSLHPPHPHLAQFPGMLAYGIWAMVQQFILQSFFFVRLESALKDAHKAVWASALLFAGAHVPSPVLTLATFAGALFFCEVFRRFRNIYPLGIAHALLGLTVAVSVPHSILHHMRVGIAYLHFH